MDLQGAVTVYITKYAKSNTSVHDNTREKTGIEELLSVSGTFRTSVECIMYVGNSGVPGPSM